MVLQPTKYIWMDGKLVLWKNAKVHVLTHSLHYGSGVFEGIRCYNTIKGSAVFRLKEHVDRLFRSAKVVNMKVPFSKKQISNAILKLLKKNKIKACYIRPIIFYGYGMMGLDIRKAPVNVAIIVWPWGKYLGESVKVKVSSFIRIHPYSTDASAKITGHYINSILAGLEARKQGYHEALLLDYKGDVAEGPGENFFFIKNNLFKKKVDQKGKIKATIYTPKLGNILPGITRDAVKKIAKELKLKVVEKDLHVNEIKKADEAFFTGTAAEITPISKIDKTKLKIGPITKQIQEKFYKIVNAQDKKYIKWLSFVR